MCSGDETGPDESGDRNNPPPAPGANTELRPLAEPPSRDRIPNRLGRTADQHWDLQSEDELREAVEAHRDPTGHIDWARVAAALHTSPARCRKRWQSHVRPAGWAQIQRNGIAPEEPPAYAPSAYEARRAGTVQNGRLQTADKELRTRLRPVLNVPSRRPPKPRRRDRVRTLAMAPSGWTGGGCGPVTG